MRASRPRTRWILAGTLLVGAGLPALAQGMSGLHEPYPARAAEQEARLLADRIQTTVTRMRERMRDIASLPAPGNDQLSLLGPGIRWNVEASPPGVTEPGPTVLDDPKHDRLWVSAGKGLGAIAIPHGWFGTAIGHLPFEPGAMRYLLDTHREPLPGSPLPDGRERELVLQLALDGRGVLESAQSHLAAARVTATGWTVVVRHPASGVWTGLKQLDGEFLAPATVVSTVPTPRRSAPRQAWSWLGGVALLAGLAVVAGKDPNHLVRLGGRLRQAARRPLALVRDLQVPDTLPRALGPDELDFLRTEQVRNLREIWTHTEERLTGQRHWVRDEIKRLHDEVNEGRRHLAIELNSLASRLEDERMESVQQLAELRTRIDRMERNHRELETLASETRDWLEEQRSRDDVRESSLGDVQHAVQQVLDEVRHVTEATRQQTDQLVLETSRSLEGTHRRTENRVDQVETQVEAIAARVQSMVTRQQEAFDRMLTMEQRTSQRLREIEDRVARQSS